MENDGDRGGTSVDDKRHEEYHNKEWLTEDNYEIQKSDMVNDEYNTQAKIESLENPVYTNSKIESLENPAYTDSVSSHDSEAPLICLDQNSFWDKEALPEDVSDVNQAYLNTVTNMQNVPVEELEDSYQGKLLNYLEDPIFGAEKQFEVSVVDIDSHIANSLHDEYKTQANIDSLENPAYTNSVSSNDSETPLICNDQNNFWEKEALPEDDSNVNLLENPAYLNTVTNTQNVPVEEPDDSYQHDQGNIVNCLDDPIFGAGKGFEVSVVEIVPHIANSLHAEPLWESTAYIDEYTCPSPGARRLERVCKNALINLSQDISCKSSLKGSTLLPVLINQVPEPVLVEEESFFEGNEIKNLLVISVCVALMNAAFSSLRNLQSSLNHKGGVGLYSLAGSCGAFTLLSLFTPSIIQQFRPRRCLIVAVFTHLLYVAANIIPEFYILVPASVLQGLGAALLWNAVSTYITYLARSSAIRNDKRTVHVAAKYFGVFFCFFQLSVVVGNLISSVVLVQHDSVQNNATSITQELDYITNKNLNDSIHANIPLTNFSMSEQGDLSICGSKYCHSFPIAHSTILVSETARYNLLGIYGVATVLSLILPLFLMDTLKNYRTARISCKQMIMQASAVIRCIVDPRFLSCIVLFFYSNMELGFVISEVTKAFVTCPVGIHMVGYTMICFGVCGSFSSFVGGKLEKHVGSVTLISAATIIDLVLLAVMLVWQPKPEPAYLYFLLLGAWGVGDGIWMSQVNCIVSKLFPDTLEEAFAALRVMNGLGITVGFSYASSLCMTSKMYILFFTCLTGTILYVTSEVMRRYRSNKTKCEDIELSI